MIQKIESSTSTTISGKTALSPVNVSQAMMLQCNQSSFSPKVVRSRFHNFVEVKSSAFDENNKRHLSRTSSHLQNKDKKILTFKHRLETDEFKSRLPEENNSLNDELSSLKISSGDELYPRSPRFSQPPEGSVNHKLSVDVGICVSVPSVIDTKSSLSNNCSPHKTSDNDTIYMVQFKRRITAHLCPSNETHAVGAFVLVSATDPVGLDLGVVVEVTTSREYEAKLERALAAHKKNRRISKKVAHGTLLRAATVAERQRLPMKDHSEQSALEFAKEISRNMPSLPMTVFDAEYTFDRSKLTLYYNSEVHIDFRELVKDMYARYKTRIWMKKMNQEPPFYPRHFATVQLLTGAQLTPY